MQNNKTKRKLLPETRFLIIVASAIFLAMIISFNFIRITFIRGDSMAPTANEGDWLVSFPLAYCFSEPEKDDIILFERRSLTAGYIIKRVIALPGETVEIIDGVVFVDGIAIEDEFSVPDEKNDFGPYTVEEDRYFVLGDNRVESVDSRYWVEPTVSKKELRGKVFWKFPKKMTEFFNSY